MPFEFHRYRDHLFRLGAEDRRLRFGAFATDERIAAFANGIDPRETRVLAWLDADLEVVAAVQVSMVPGRAVELAFTVDPAYRRMGVGAALMTRALLWARNRGFCRACVHCLAENIPMRRLARHAGMDMTTASGETEAFMALANATPLTYAAEILGEGVGLVDLAVKANRTARTGGAPAPAFAAVP
jgi:GNAT superfamily N-acetyltransferase